jgi:hypothetical protein
MENPEEIPDEYQEDIDGGEVDVNVFQDDSDEDVEIVEDIPRPKQKKPNPVNPKQKKNFNEFKNDQQNKQVALLNKTIFKGVNIKTCSADELKAVFVKLENKWIVENFQELQTHELIVKWNQNFGVTTMYDMDALHDTYKRLYAENYTLQKYFKLKNVIDFSNLQDPYILIFKKITFMIDYGYKILSGTITARRIMDSTFDTLSNIEETFFRCTVQTPTDDCQKLKVYLLEMLSYNQCMRYGNYVCQQKFIDGHASHYWEKRWTIDEFVEEYTHRHTHAKMWEIREIADNHSKVIKYLTTKNCAPEFPDVVRTSGVYACRNGLYNCRHTDENGKLTFKLYTYGEEVIPKELNACKFIDQEFTGDQYTKGDYTKWRDIPTPNYDKLIRFQFAIYKEDAENIYDTFNMLLGRLFAPLRKYDKWELFPFLVGLAGCGKSMILLEVVAKLFENIDIGFIQDTNEGKFAYGPFAEKKVLIGTEIKKTFNTPATLFQQIVSGENVTLPIKGGDPVEQMWTAPMILGGNELFGLADKGGSIARRTLKIPFYRKVREKDKIMNMDQLLTDNILNILHKITCAYLEFREKLGDDSPWLHLCPFFIEQREKVTKETNPFYGYLNDKGVVNYDKDACCSLATVRLSYKNYCKEHQLNPGPQFGEDTYLAPFADMGYNIGHDINVEYNVKKKHPDEDGNMIEDKIALDYVNGLYLVEGGD